MKQVSRVFKVVLLLLALGMPAVPQGKPIIQLQPFTSFYATAAEDGCGFDILVTPQAGRPNGERVILFANSEIIAGPLFQTVENLSTKRTINLNVSGPGFINFSGNTFVLRGASDIVLPANVATAAGLPISLVSNGQVVLTLDAQGNITSASATGTVQDLCALLQ